MPSQDIWIFTEYNGHEFNPVTLEMISEAVKLRGNSAADICLCIFGRKENEQMRPIAGYGAQKLYWVDDDRLSTYSLDYFLAALEQLLVKHQPMMMMFGATPYGSELAPRIAARLKLPCITEVKRLKSEGDHLAIAKSCYNEKGYQNFYFRPDRSVILSVLPGDMEAEKANTPLEIQTVKESVDLNNCKNRTRSIEYIKGDPKKISLTEADLIVAGGKGIGKDLSLLENLADSLGASVGGSRPLVDDGVIPFERQIGITGKSIGPSLLITCGISGAREFAAGMEKAGLIVAINTDRKASIFNFADLGILGDVNEVIPALIQKLNQRKKNQKINLLVSVQK